MNILNNYTTNYNSAGQNPNVSQTQGFKTPNGKSKASIFYVNDIHGQVPKMQRLVSASLHAGVDAQNKGADILRLCSGDTFIGSDEKRNNVAATFLNVAGFDAHALGNHEFDITASKCADLLKNSKTKILATNLNFPDNQTQLSKEVLRSMTVKAQSGEMYGLIGIQPIDLEERIKDKDEKLQGITVDNLEQTKQELRDEIQKLKSQGINKIILLSHSGLKTEKDIAQSVDGIDVILGGHSHDLVEGVQQNENLFYSPSGEPVVITQAGRDGNYFGLLNLEFDELGRITYIQNNVNDTNIYSSNTMMEKEADKVLGESPQIGVLNYSDPTPKNYMIEENPWADFVADALRTRLDADIAIVNSANFRGSVDKGPITARDITSIFPFNNKMLKVKISEKDIVDAIRICAKTITNENHKPGFMQVSGLTYTVDSQGNLKDMYFVDKQNNKHKIDVNNPDANKMYTAVYDEFLFQGGDDLVMLRRKDSDIIEKYDFEKGDVTIDYIKSLKQPFDVRKDGRIKVEN